MASTDEDRTRSFWRTLPGILTGVAAVITAVATLVGALAAVGVLSGGDDEPPAGRSGTAPVALEADAGVAAARIERGCLDFHGSPPSQCRCFAERVAAALPEQDLDAASRAFRAEGRFPTGEQQELTDDILRACRPEE